LFLDQAERLDVELALEAEEITEPTTLIGTGATWKYWDNKTLPAPDWNQLQLDDTGWKQGPAPLGYGESDIATSISYGTESRHKHITAWFRHRFKLDSAASVTNLYISLRRDDGAVVYINGKEVARDSLPPGEITPTTIADVTQDEAESIYRIFKVPAATLLQTGENLVAVEVHQNEARSSDLAMDLELLANFLPPLPTSIDNEQLKEILGNALPASLKR